MEDSMRHRTQGGGLWNRWTSAAFKGFIVNTIGPVYVKGGALFVITKVLFVIRIHVFYRILPVFYTFPKTDRILQNTSRTHKNTQEYEHVEECERHILRKCENTTEYGQNTASRWYSPRVQNTTQEYRAEYAKEYRILHRIQNTANNTVSYMQNTTVFRGQAHLGAKEECPSSFPDVEY